MQKKSTHQYTLPSVKGNLIYHTSWATSNLQEEANTILSVLNTYNIHCVIVKLNQGPTLTQYVISLDIGTPVQSLLRREKNSRLLYMQMQLYDLKMAMYYWKFLQSTIQYI